MDRFLDRSYTNVGGWGFLWMNEYHKLCSLSLAGAVCGVSFLLYSLLNCIEFSVTVVNSLTATSSHARYSYVNTSVTHKLEQTKFAERVLSRVVPLIFVLTTHDATMIHLDPPSDASPRAPHLLFMYSLLHGNVR